MLICLSVFPFVNDSRSLLILFTQIFIFAIFAMSFDVLLGYTGIVSFGHCMFFGIGAYGVALLFDRQGVSITNFLIGIVAHAHQLKNFHYPQVTKNVILSKKL
ncbi:ABC transporter permease subunit, partial [Bacillus tropicus]|uniref:ABC transporter permease subunit n=1 Tax=Bacillus tropicus TaxID=2026188 RepID=UPI002EA59DED|nr:hypothetical protein [Bacillus tropicus]